MPDEIIIEGLEEHAFRRSIEIMLRNGRADEAVERLKALLPECAGEGKTLPGRLLEIGPEHIKLVGWDQLAAKVEEYSRPSIPITAIGIGIGDPADLGLEPDAVGNLRPPLATSYYSDATFPFSETDRADLLEGYSAFGCEWQGDHDRIDETLSIEGIDDLYGAIVRLENEVAASDNPDAAVIRAGAIGACYLGVMVWQAARRAVIEQGLPRPMAILLVNSDAYPFFDAPVLTCDEYLDDGTLQVIEHVRAVSSDDAIGDEPEDTASLVGMAGLGAHRETSKKMALVLEGAEAHNPLGMADDLVAQAAFDPSSVDISRFMPDAADFRNEPDPEFEPEAELEPEPEPEAELEPELEPEPEPEQYDAQDDEPDHDREAEPEPAAAQLEADQALDQLEYPVDTDVADEAEQSELAHEHDFLDFRPSDFYDDTPTMPSVWSPPEWAEVQAPTHAATVGNDATEAGPADASMPGHGQNADLPFAPEPARAHISAQPASHALRARIRATPTEEVLENSSGGPLTALVRFFKGLADFVLRR